MNSPAALKEVLERGFSMESVIRYKIGFNPGDAQRRDIRAERQDWGLEDQLKEDGTFRKLCLPVGLVIPTLDGAGVPMKVKIRRTTWTEGDKLPKYVEVSGSKSSPSVYEDTNLPAGLILESEFDALLLQQEVGDLIYCIALGGSTKPIDRHTDTLLKRTKVIFFLPDFDAAGATAWVKWKRLYPYIHQVLTERGKSAGPF
jgi:DNA primase